MDYRSFTTICSMYHGEWLAQNLGMTASRAGGIDISNDTINIELKSRMRDWHPTWTIHAYQINQFPKENKGKELYWGFLLYGLTKTVPSIKHKDLPHVIIDREVWLMPWDWVWQFPVHRPKTGPYVYVKQHKLPDPKTFSRFPKKRGAIWVPKGSSLEDLL